MLSNHNSGWSFHQLHILKVSFGVKIFPPKWVLPNVSIFSWFSKWFPLKATPRWQTLHLKCIIRNLMQSPRMSKKCLFSLNPFLHPFAPVRSALWSAAVFLYASLPLFVFRFSSHCFSNPPPTVSVWLVVSQLSLSPLFRRRPRALDDDICHLDFTIGRLFVFPFSRMSECFFPCFYPAAFVSPVKIVPVV